MVERRRGGRSTAARPGATGGKGDAPVAERKKGEKGAGKGKDDARKGAVKGSGKGKGKGEGKNAPLPGQERHVMGAKTVQELEAEMKVASGANTKERREAAKQPLEAKGRYCEVKKHSEMGCAVISFADPESKDAVFQLALNKRSTTDKDNQERPVLQIGGVDVQMRFHVDKATGKDLPNDIFVAWGRQAEKESKLAPSLISEAIDLLLVEARPQAQPLPQQQQPIMASLQQMVPGPQQQHLAAQQQYQAMAAMAWAQQAAAHVAAQQMQAQAVPPPSPQPSTQAQSMLETPPRAGGMRAEANEFTPPPVAQQSLFDPYSNYTYNENEYAEWNQAYGQPSKRFEIVNPANGEKVTVEKSNLSEGAAVFEPQFGPSRKPVKIVNPNTNEQVDTLGMIFEKPKPTKSFSIKDPTSGNAITAS